jgi:hypothetical protein
MRRSGQTTRLVDQAVQTLFTRGVVTFEDHHFVGNRIDHFRANKFGFDILVRRLKIEHGFNRNIVIDEKNLTIKLKKE